MFTHITDKVQLDEIQDVTLPNGRRYYTLPSGKKVPSITSILSYFKRDIIKEWKDRVGEEEANRICSISSGRGTDLHSICEKYLDNDPLYLKDAMPDAMVMFKSIREHINRINNIHYQEAKLYSNKLLVAGRTDVIGEFDGILSVIDFKNSIKVKPKEWIHDYFMQECFYALSYEERGGPSVDQLVTIIANENDPPSVYIEKTEDWIQPLLDVIVQYKRENVSIT